jgi:hypothetical protein
MEPQRRWRPRESGARQGVAIATQGRTVVEYPFIKYVLRGGEIAREAGDCREKSRDEDEADASRRKTNARGSLRTRMKLVRRPRITSHNQRTWSRKRESRHVARHVSFRKVSVRSGHPASSRRVASTKNNMAKTKNAKKQTKKAPSKTAKQKKQAKAAKKR